MLESATLDVQTSSDTPAVIPPPPSVQIPDGDPAAASLAILAAINPSAAAEIHGRIAGIAEQLAGLVESARLDPAAGLVPFLRRAARLIRLRKRLQERLGRLQGSAGPPDGQTVQDEVCKLARSVKRWRNGRAMAEEGASIISGVRSKLAEADTEVQALVAEYQQGHAFVAPMSSPAYQAGMTARDDEFLRRLEERLTHRAPLANRLGRLDPGGNASRAACVTKAIATAGGVDAVREMLKPAMGVDGSQLTMATAEIRSLNDQLQAVDPETERARALAKRRDEFQARGKAFAAQVDAQRGAAADALLRNAAIGIPEGAKHLESVARAVGSGIVEQLELLGTDPAELIAIVDEIIG